MLWPWQGVSHEYHNISFHLEIRKKKKQQQKNKTKKNKQTVNPFSFVKMPYLALANMEPG